MKTKLTSRLLSLFLALMMVICLVPVSVLADETSDERATEAMQQTEEASVEELQEEQEPLPEEVPDEALVEVTPAEEPEEVENTEEPVENNTMPMSNGSFVSETHDVFKHTESTIAPGVEQYINYAYAKDGKQMVYYVATADISRDDVLVQSAYKDAQCQNFGMDKLTNQMAAATAKYSDPSNEAFISEYYTAVAGTNADFYNMTTGQPSGAFVIDGVMSSNKANNRPWFAIFADGTALCGANNADWDAAVAAHGAVQQAVGGSQVLVKNGADVTASASGSYNTDRHSRTMVGVTADGKVVMAVLDGRQEPFSCGGTMHELAQIMLEAECVSAINLDGGGSTTFAARPEGENAVKVINRPSDGSERSISSGLLIASTAVPSDVFDHATLTAENEYVTPGSTVRVSATGVSPAGTAAAIPEDVTYTATLGTVTSDGVFTSDGTAGDAVISMVYNEQTVGEATVHVVVPEAIKFDQEKMTVPYGKTVILGVTATYGLNEVVLKDGDVTFALDNDAVGTIEGFAFTASEEIGEASNTSGITAVNTFDETVTATATITLGKGSEVLFDFEDGTNQGIGLSDVSYNYYLPNHSTQVVDKNTGKVHSGEYALALNMDFTNSLESGYQRLSLFYRDADRGSIYSEAATRLGMWVYIPDECVSLWARWQNINITAVNEDGTYTTGGVTGQVVDGTINGTPGYVYSFEEPGWHYISVDTSAYKGVALRSGYYCFQFYISDRDGASFDYYFKDQNNVNGNFTFYIDDITVDYSDAVDDREAPIFSELNYGTTAMADAVAIAKRSVPTVGYNVVDFAAKVAENTVKTNATGLDVSTAKAYVDGNEVPCTYSGGVITMDQSATLADGQHTIKFSICDNQGNYASIIRKINVQANSGAPTIKVVPHDNDADRVLLGSVNYVDVVATDVEKVQSVTMRLDLDNMSKWQLEHMDVATGFEATWMMEGDDKAENIAALTITRTEDVDATGEAVLVSIPIRTWELIPVTVNGKTYNYTTFGKEFWPVAIDLEVDQGLVTYVDGATDTFAGEGVFIWTEMWANFANMTATAEGKAYYEAWNHGHTHTAAAMDDKAATCTEAGYTGRTFCEVCNSVVDWGTTIPATGHSYDFVDGVLKCTTCGELFTGEWTDGKAYKDGVVVSDGWVGSSYYQDGVKLTGVQKVPATDGSGEFYYDFGDSGVSAGKYTGLFWDNDDLYYVGIGSLMSGWRTIDTHYYYFGDDFRAVNGTVRLDGHTYQFDNYILVSGEFVKTDNGLRYYWAGHHVGNQWFEINGNTYRFDINGYALTGLNIIQAYSNGPRGAYAFDDNGVLIEQLLGNGLKHYGMDTVCLKNDEVVFAGLVQEDGYYYYVDTTFKAVRNTSKYVSETKANWLMPAGVYEFNNYGQMVVEEKQGIIEENGKLYYYENGAKVAKGVVKTEDGKYYFFGSSLYASTGMTRFIASSKCNGLIPEGTYVINDDGTIVVSTTKEGIVEENGKLYYYENGAKVAKGVVKTEDGKYYFFGSSLYASTGMTRFIASSKCNGLIPEGTYVINDDGTIVM